MFTNPSSSFAHTALCVDIRVCSVLFYELSSRLNVVAHQHGEYLIGIGGVLYCNLLEQPCGGVHGGVPQLFGVHLTETFVPLRVDGVGIAVSILLYELQSLLLGVSIFLHLVLV